ncbi:substrate-binding periplasmic protein [Pseudoalteromonas denitrificans]|uniref:ABC-type amino acid transport substrate-binding protein n=1 Tax=Pseudoalteromonas denitrificans DSM 6059 TaxID=1123010 RepID=A0A1I1KB92_9GAMM|nr:transporter substrate-binding domain-containing protein [Pseudoalteromonas denitrificans]SFC58147.1 ABC-type amino acid transport substrate-binding protein [Pseudoalteromonas denitrificans DSM 6059]
MLKSIYSLSFLLVIISTLTSQSSSYASEGMQCDHLVIAGAQSWFPYSYVQEGNKYYQGLLINSLKDAIEDKSISLSHWSDLPWKRAELQLNKGKVDIILGAFHTPQRAKTWYFSKPLANSELVLFSLNDILDVTRIEELYNKEVSYPFGMATGKKFAAIKSHIKTEHIVHHEQIYGMILKQHTDFGLLPRTAVETYLSQHKLKDKFKIHPLKLNSEAIYLVTSMNNPCLTKIKFIFANLKRVSQ